MSTEQKLHLAAVTSLVTAAILFTTSWITTTWNGLWVLSILGVFGFVSLEGWVGTHYGRDTRTAANEDGDR